MPVPLLHTQMLLSAPALKASLELTYTLLLLTTAGLEHCFQGHPGSKPSPPIDASGLSTTTSLSLNSVWQLLHLLVQSCVKDLTSLLLSILIYKMQIISTSLHG